MRTLVVGLLAASVALSGCIDLPFDQKAKAEALAYGNYVRDVQVAVQTLGIVFAQADESVKAFQHGWLAPEGAASQFDFLHDQVKSVKSGISKSQPPADMASFHRQLGRSVTLTQQAMDAMGEGFRSGDPAWFEVAQGKLGEAREVLDSAVQDL